MKITDVQATHLRVEDPNISLFDGSYDDCVIVIHTDEGVSGVGGTESLASAVQAVVAGQSAHNHARALCDVLLGCDIPPPTLRALAADVRRHQLRRPARSCHACHQRRRSRALGPLRKNLRQTVHALIGS